MTERLLGVVLRRVNVH
jgi:hypothetical protein